MFSCTYLKNTLIGPPSCEATLRALYLQSTTFSTGECGPPRLQLILQKWPISTPYFWLSKFFFHCHEVLLTANFQRASNCCRNQFFWILFYQTGLISFELKPKGACQVPTQFSGSQFFFRICCTQSILTLFFDPQFLLISLLRPIEDTVMLLVESYVFPDCFCDVLWGSWLWDEANSIRYSLEALTSADTSSTFAADH